MIAGSLEIQMWASMARIEADMASAKRIVGGAMGEIEKMAAMANTALGALGGVLSVGAFVSWVDGAIESADSMNDLSKSTGIAVEQLAGLKLAAQQSGADLEGTAQAINKLSVKMGENAEKYAKIGVTAKDPLEAFKQLSDIFNKIDDPQKRAAFGAEALGKSWGSAAPLLAEGSAGIQEMVDKGAKLSGITKEVAEQADKFNDSMVVMRTISGAAALGIAKDVMPIMTAFAESMIDSKGRTEDLAGAFPKLSEVLRTFIVFGGNVMFVLKAIGTEIGGIAAQAAAVASGNFKMAGDIGDMMKDDAIASRAAFDEWESKMLSAGAAAVETAKKADKASESLTKTQLAAVKAFSSSPTAKTKTAGETAFESFAADAAKREALLTAEAGGVAKLTDAEKWALEVMVKVRDGKLGQSDAERRLIGERVEAVAVLEKLNAQEKINEAAMGRHADAVGTDQAAAQSIMDANTAMREQSAELGLSSEALAALKQARIDDKIALQTWRLGLLGGVDASGAQADAIRETIAALQDSKVALAENTSAQKAADAILAKQSEWSVGAAEALHTYADTARNVAQQTQDLFTNALNAGEDAFVEFAKTGKLSFSDLADSIIEDMARMAYKSAMAPITEGIGNWVKGMFGSAASSSSSFLGNGITLSGASSSSSFLGNGITLSGARAGGGGVSSGGTYLVGEKGPELLTMGGNGYITPNNALGGSNVSVVVNNTASDKVEATVQPRMNNGKLELEVLVQQVMARDMRSNGRITQGFSNTFGLSRAS